MFQPTQQAKAIAGDLAQKVRDFVVSETTSAIDTVGQSAEAASKTRDRLADALHRSIDGVNELARHLTDTLAEAASKAARALTDATTQATHEVETTARHATVLLDEATNAAVRHLSDAARAVDRSLTVVAIDFGIKRNILRRLASYGCRIIVVPADTPPETILAYDPDGVFLSNGPGDPAAVTEGIETAKALLAANKPMFGICLGHQILGLSMGANTFKLKFGHRGLNQPCGLSQHVEITSQNHGFAIDADSLADSPARVTHLNLNDRTVAGLEHESLPIFSVQYHPEASPGPHDADYLFERFVREMQQYRDRKATSAR